MEYCMITHKVADFNKWKLGFDDHASVRKDYGITVTNVFRGKEDKNSISVIAKAESSEKFEKFFMSKDLKEGMERAGVVSAPEISWLDCVE